ncbi:MAG: NAD(P)-binding protein [Acidimicrobiales bacterium]
MTRAQIADPDLVEKLASGRRAEIRPCILCNQKCRVRDGRNPIVSCTVNPTTGFEHVEAERVTGSMSRRVVHVVGAGPAGLEAARLCAEAGAHVQVWERGPKPNQLIRTWATASEASRWCESPTGLRLNVSASVYRFTSIIESRLARSPTGSLLGRRSLLLSAASVVRTSLRSTMVPSYLTPSKRSPPNMLRRFPPTDRS